MGLGKCALVCGREGNRWLFLAGRLEEAEKKSRVETQHTHTTHRTRTFTLPAAQSCQGFETVLRAVVAAAWQKVQGGGQHRAAARLCRPRDPPIVAAKLFALRGGVKASVAVMAELGSSLGGRTKTSD